MNSKFIFITIFIFEGFISFFSNKNIVGSYESHQLSGFEKTIFKLKYGTRSTIEKSELHLKVDSSFFIETCGFKALGKWRVSKDKLELLPEKGHFKNDSINTLRGGLSVSNLQAKGLLNYKITDDYLIAKVSKSTGGHVLLIFKNKI